MSSSGKSSTSLLTSIGLFVGTVLASQWLYKRSVEKKTKEKERIEEQIRRDFYKLRRLHDRLSFEIHHGTNENENQTPTMQQGSSTFQQDESDFIPKNHNWNHFELFNEEDVENGVVNPIEFNASGYLYEEEDEGMDEEQFVWTGSNQDLSLRGSKLLASSREHNSADQVCLPPSARYPMESLDKKNPPNVTMPVTPKFSPEWKHLMRAASVPLKAKKPTFEGESYDVPGTYRKTRAQYNARIMPKKLVMLRHGQSMGNTNENYYATTPDNSMPLTKLGWEQARKAGMRLKERVLGKNETVHFIVSPYVRTVETFHGIASAWCDPKEFSHIRDRDLRVKAWYGRLLEMGLTWHEDPRIREQDFGNYQDPETIRKAKIERHKFGVFYYRFHNGESASDVYDRVSTFLDSLWRSFDMNRSRNYVLVTHGIAIRVLLARYFRYTIQQFHLLANPRNCEMVVLGHDGHGRLSLEGRHQQVLGTNEATGERTIEEYIFSKRLRVLPEAHIRRTHIRISFDD